MFNDFMISLLKLHILFFFLFASNLLFTEFQHWVLFKEFDKYIKVGYCMHST